MAPAMGVTQVFYQSLAQWLSAAGYLVITFDYRGIGASREESLRRLAVDILDWARNDCAAMINAAIAGAPGQPIFWIGHSLGGQILPFIPNRERLSKIITVASGSGYWRENAPALRPKALVLWYALVPVCIALFGYFPGKRLRTIGDLPCGVILQWRRWCLNPRYAAGAEGAAATAAYASVTTPIVSISFSDDEMMSRKSIESLNLLFTGAPVTRMRLSPTEAGVKRIGHFGFFRRELAQTLWRSHLLPALEL